ncbi:hypothetical protein [Streptomyces sp. UH6]|uniref:hypothetical protein n=1 Tax=Streptomyces sp. UH6 TaxID=2748379 RepID=UPI0015D4FBE4|nr:hypothetical protein [Streptomyces sp. UH6]NYV74479.1 hypothetical protein [Streptomyces sp. UH6]
MTRLRTWTRTTFTRLRGPERDRGASFIEYAGLLIIVAGIFVLIDGLGLDGQISNAIGDAVQRVVGGG